MPESTNTHQNIVKVGEGVFPAAMLSGNVVLSTKFYADGVEVSSCAVRVHYT